MTSDGHGPCVSVIMPVFNAGAYVTEALASVAAQTYRDYEVVIVDDGSTEERTLAALDRARDAPRTTVIRTENRGPAARSEEHTSELQSHHDLVCRLLLEKKNTGSTAFSSPTAWRPAIGSRERRARCPRACPSSWSRSSG